MGMHCPAGLRPPLAKICRLCVGLGIAAMAPAEQPAAEPREARDTAHLSSKLHEVLTEKLPRYQPPTPESATTRRRPAIFAPGTLVRDTPPEGVLLLPDFQVETSRVIKLSDSSVLTEKGRAALAAKQFPGLGLNLPMGKAERRVLEQVVLAVLTRSITYQVFGRGDDAQETLSLELQLQEKLARDKADLKSKLSVANPGLDRAYDQETQRMLHEASAPDLHDRPAGETRR